MEYICGCFNYKKMLDENMPTLRKKMEELTSREADINKELGNENDLEGKMRKRKVETWLRNVKCRRHEVQQIEQEFGKRRYFPQWKFLRMVENNVREVAKLIEEGKFPEGLFIDVHPDREVVLMTPPLVGQSIKERNLRKFWNCLMDDGILSIGVYGMGGVGKTTMLTQIHERLLASTSTFDHVYWVTVSQESSIPKLQDDIAKVIQLDLSVGQDERKRAAELSVKLTEKKKFVLILDDMWTVVPPERLGIPIGVNAGKLIVTTRSLDVCQGLNCQQNIKVKSLPMKEAWVLFMENLGHETVLAPDIEEVAKSIAKTCGGLPLVIITTARSMRGVDDIHEWRDALIKLRERTMRFIDMAKEVFKHLKFSYDHLNDEKLQQCLLYCALFPEDHKIKRKDLILYWIAEGLVDEMETRQAEFEEGHALLNKLENAHLLEHTKDSEGEICVKLHDLIRDMALNITRVNPQFMVKAGVQLMVLPDETQWSEELERVSLAHNKLWNLSQISPKCPRLRTLMLQSNSHMREIPNSLFEHMPNLIVLDLSDSGIEDLPDSICDLEKLRALLLNGCTNLSHVPSLAKLTELRELDLRRTGIKNFPHGMGNLVNLKRLDLYRIGEERIYKSVLQSEVLPTGILPKLSHLQSLMLFLFRISTNVQVEEIVSLRQLEVLVVLFKNIQVFNSYIKTSHWQRLTKYSLQIMNSQYQVSDGARCREVHMGDCKPLEGEQVLVLPTNIQQLNIYNCHDLRSLLDFSSSLNNVRGLERCWIESCHGIEHLWSWSNTTLLQRLRTLVLSLLPKLNVLFTLKGSGVGGKTPLRCGTFSNLQLFSVGDCPNLKYVFTHGLVQNYLQNLEVIHVYCCSNMEDIILVEEEEEKKEETTATKEEEKEVRGAAYERDDHNYSNDKSIITCPKLQSMELKHLPKLKSIWKGTIVCHSLQQILVRRCPMLKKLPLFLHLNDDPQRSSTVLSLKQISGEEDWWDLLEWGHPDAKSLFQPLFDAKISPRGFSRAAEMWWQDSEHYDL